MHLSLSLKGLSVTRPQQNEGSMNYWTSGGTLINYLNRVSLDGAGQLSGYITSWPSVSVPRRPLYGSVSRAESDLGKHTYIHSYIKHCVVKTSYCQTCRDLLTTNMNDVFQVYTTLRSISYIDPVAACNMKSVTVKSHKSIDNYHYSCSSRLQFWTHAVVFRVKSLWCFSDVSITQHLPVSNQRSTWQSFCQHVWSSLN